jgi:hypothetical protein
MPHAHRHHSASAPGVDPIATGDMRPRTGGRSWERHRQRSVRRSRRLLVVISTAAALLGVTASAFGMMATADGPAAASSSPLRSQAAEPAELSARAEDAISRRSRPSATTSAVPPPAAPTTPETTPEPVTPAPSAEPASAGAGSSLPALAPGSWLSGVGQSGPDLDIAAFAAWRGSQVGLLSMWEDDNQAMTELWGLRPGGVFGSWDGPIDIAVGALGDGESWEKAAAGAYDARWRQSLQNLADLRAGRTGTTFIRFAHEMNGNWYPWSVNAGNHQAFIQAWRHFRALQQEIFPHSQLVFGLNRESYGNGIDWRQTFPGAEHVDVMAVDYYNQYPCVRTAEEWDAAVVATDEHGAPRGIEQHRRFAESVGLPLAVPEWAGNADQCDSAVYIQGMHDFFRQHAGSGAGQVLYEAYFNVNIDGDKWRIQGGGRMPAAAEAYRSLF